MCIGEALGQGVLGRGTGGEEIRRGQVHVHRKLTRAVNRLLATEHAHSLATFSALTTGRTNVKTKIEVLMGVLCVFQTLSLDIAAMQVEQDSRGNADGNTGIEVSMRRQRVAI